MTQLQEVNMFAQRLKAEIENITQEIQAVQDEMDRRDSFDSYSHSLREKLQALQAQLEKNKNLYEQFKELGREERVS